MGKRVSKYPNQTVERLTALRGILNMHERAIKAGEACKLNGESRNFNMDTWDCGTAACALGSAAINPWFKERGLHMGESFFGPTPKFKKTSGIQAGAEFLGITWHEAKHLFDYTAYDNESVYDAHVAGSNITPAMVRDRVDALIVKYSQVSK